MSKKKNCELKNQFSLYSSANFDPESIAESKTIEGVRPNDKVTMAIKFVSEYEGNYFRSIVSLIANIDNTGVITKSKVCVKDIYFKNQLNVSASSKTIDYGNLYTISSSSADNNKSSSSSSKCSAQSIINKKKEKDIAINVKEFVNSDAFALVLNGTSLIVTLDVRKCLGDSGVPKFSIVKNSVKYKVICESSSLLSSDSSDSSNSSDSSDSSSCSKPNNFLKLLMICVVIAFIAMLITKLKKKNYTTQYKNLLKGVVNKVKEFVTIPNSNNIPNEPDIYPQI